MCGIELMDVLEFLRCLSVRIAHDIDFIFENTII